MADYRPTLAAAVAAMLAGVAAAVDAPAPSAPIPLTSAARLLFASVRVNGQGPFNMVLDTGASETVLTPPVAARLGLRVTPVTSSQGAARVASIALGGAVVRDLPVRVFDPVAARPLRLNYGLDYHGLVGATFLRHFVVEVDYATPAMRLLDRGWAPARTGGVPFDVSDGLVRVPVTLGGHGPFAFLLDTGATETLVFPITAARAGIVPPAGGWGRARAASVAVASWVTSNQTVVVDGQADPRIARAYDGILGYPYLSRYRVVIDYPRSRLFLDPPVSPTFR